MLDIKKEVRDIRRFNQIAVVLIEEGLGEILRKLKPNISFKKGKKSKKHSLKPEQKLRMTFERLGPTFIKFGQILSVRPDLLPKEYIAELEKLQDEVPPFEYKKVKSIVEHELGKKIKEVFRKFEERPIASASISQVHRAILNDGTKVAVKVQRPNIQQIIQTDIEILYFFAKLLEKHFKELRHYKPVDIVKEFESWTNREIDFSIEARNAQIFYHNFKGSKIVRIPKVYPKYSSEKVITLEFLDGVEIHKMGTIKKRWFDIGKVIDHGFDAVLTQVFMHGFFHADPHPGNILILKNNVIAFVDFGIVGYFDRPLKEKCIKLFVGILEEDVDAVVETLLEICSADSQIAVVKFKQDVSRILFEMQAGSEIKDMKVSLILEEILHTGVIYGMRMPTEFVLFGKTLITLEGLALEYSPDFRFLQACMPFIRKMQRAQLRPGNIANNLAANVLRMKRFVSNLPEKVDKTLESIQRGTVKIDIEDSDIKRLAVEIDKSSNRLVYGGLIAAFLVSGALIMQVGGPEIYGVPFLSFLAFLFAGIVGLFLLISILRENSILQK